MSFYTSLTGLNGAQADIAAISNNIANVGTTGFKRSRAEFGDIFATSPLQAASSAIGSGTILKSIKQQFTQGNIESSLNALDLAISGQGFFALKPSLTSTQTVYTRNGAFSVNNDRYVVDSQGQLLQVFPVNADGSVIATGINSAQNLQLPTTSGLPKASQTIQLGLNLPADAEIIPNKSQYTSSNPYVFDKTNPATYNKSTSITIYDSLGNPTIATIYYVKTSNATETSPTNKWQTHVFVGDREVTPQLITAKDDQSKSYYINKFGQITTDPQAVDPTFNAAAAHPLYKQDDQVDKTASTAASAVGSIIKTSGFDFGDTDASPVTIYTDPEHYADTKEGGATGSNPAYWGRDMFTISVDGSEPQSISIAAGTYTGTQLAAELTRAVNEKYSGQKYFSVTDTYRKEGGSVIPGNDIIQVNLSKLSEDGASVPLDPPLEIDLLGTGGSAGTPQVAGYTQPDNKLTLTRDQLIQLTQQKLNDALSKRRLEFNKGSDWPDASNPPIRVGYDIGARALTFTVDPTQLGADANEPAARFNSVQVFNPTSTTNDLGLPTRSASPDILVRANTVWTGSATLPAGDSILDPREQRTGIKVSYNKDTRQFVFASGSTGESSSIVVGRSQLAESPVAQVSAYDMSNVDFTAASPSNPISVSFEVNGRLVSYNYAPNYPSLLTKQGTAAPTAPTVTTTQGTSTVTETADVALTALNAGQSVTIDGITVFANQDLTAANVATAFVSGSVSGATVSSASGSTRAWTAALSSGSSSTVTFTSKTANSDVANLVVTTAGRTESATVQFTPMTTGQTVTVGGLKLTATANLTAANVALAFSGSTVTGATMAGSLTGWTPGTAKGNTLVFTSSSPSSNVADLTSASTGIATMEDFFHQIEQSVPVTFSNTKVTSIGSNNTTETETLDISGRIMTGDQFAFKITPPNGSTESDFTINMSGLTSSSTTFDRMTALQNAINSALAADPSFMVGATQSVTAQIVNNTLTLQYNVPGAVKTPASLKQMLRGSDPDPVSAGTGFTGLTPMALTDKTIFTASSKKTDGTASTPTQFDVTLRNKDNNAPAFRVGDVYHLTVPRADGTESSYDVTIGKYANGSVDTTATGDSVSFNDFYQSVSAALPSTTVAVSVPSGSTDTLSFKILPANNVTGMVTIQQTKVSTPSSVSGGTTTPGTVVAVRPDSIGAFSFRHIVGGNNLEVEGNPNGEPFRMNVRLNGLVKTALPVGAQGSTSLNGVQVGEATAVNYKGVNDLLGVGGTANVTYVSGTGLPSTAATAVGSTAITSMSQTFFLNESLGENVMTFTVDGIVGTVSLPIRAYTGDTFAAAIQDRVNQIQDPKTGRTVSGVTVKFDPDANRLIFTSGTTGENSQINVVGHPNFGLGKVTQTAGSVPVITNLKQATDDQGNKLYVGADGQITTQTPDSLQNWYPLYLTEGQLTFDTVGKLIAPKEGVIYSPFDPQNGSDLLRLNIDYGKYSTQFSSPFSVLSLSQDGYPSGSLNGLDIDASGTIRANYTNGQTVALGKVMIANFANPNGLKQIGNANYVATSTSGQVVLGQAGADGFGNIKAGALERSNVDITEELVNLITAQRNFQANAKAIETTTQLSQTIIQIRG